MGDPNGAFVKNLQGRGFHSRIFELACFAYLQSAGLEIDRGAERPDFLVGNKECTVAVEVTTVNPPQDVDPDISMLRMEHFDLHDDSADFELRGSDKLPKRIAATLRKKLKRGYHNLPHVAGKPIVLMVAPFFEPGSVFYTDNSLVDVLYQTEPNPRETPFFWLPDAAVISAVAYCNSFTVPKFWRLADQEFLANSCTALRTGLACFENDPHLKCFRYQIGHELTPPETWSEGVTLFFNPMAATPLPIDFLPASCRFTCEGDMVLRRVTGFHPLASRMRVYPRDRTRPAPL